MKINKTFVLSLICVFLAIIAIPGFVNKQKGKNIKTSLSSLLNTKYVNQINKIEFNFAQKSKLTLTKQENWIGECNGLFFLADENVIEELIENFSKNRALTEVSKQVDNWETYSLTEDKALNIAFFNEDFSGNKTEFSSLFFGAENSDKTMVYLRNNRKPDIYQIQNDLYAYFTQKLETFANMNLFPVSKSQLLRIEKIEVFDFFTNQTKLYKLGDENFDTILNKLTSLRGGTLFSKDILNDTTFLSKTISATTMEAEKFSLNIYSKNLGDDFSYFVQFLDSNTENKINALKEISSWTYKNLEF